MRWAGSGGGAIDDDPGGAVVTSAGYGGLRGAVPGDRDARHPLTGRVARVLVATCSGCEALGRSLGLPLVHVDAVVDPAAAIRRLNVRGHASGTTYLHPSRPLWFDGGWRDWSEVARPADDVLAEEADGREGVIRVGPRLDVVLPRGATVEDFRLQLRASLRRLRLREVVGRPAWRARRFAETDAHEVPERFTGNGRDDRLEGAAVVDDLHVLDPVAGAGTLFWTAVAARMAAASPVPP